MLISEKINHAFNQQIGHEFGNSIQYLAIATHFERESLFGLAKLYYTQADEERGPRDEVRQVLARRRRKSRHSRDPRPPELVRFGARGRAACSRCGDGHNAANLRPGRAGDGREELHRFELPPVVCQRAARGSLQRRGAAHGDPAGRPQRAHGRGLPGSRNEVSGIHAGSWRASEEVASGERTDAPVRAGSPDPARPLRPTVSLSPTVGASPGDLRSAERRDRETLAEQAQLFPLPSSLFPLPSPLPLHRPLFSRPTPHDRRGPPSMPRPKLGTPLPIRQGGNMLRKATIYASDRSLSSLIFGASSYKI